MNARQLRISPVDDDYNLNEILGAKQLKCFKFLLISKPIKVWGSRIESQMMKVAIIPSSRLSYPCISFPSHPLISSVCTTTPLPSFQSQTSSSIKKPVFSSIIYRHDTNSRTCCLWVSTSGLDPISFLNTNTDLSSIAYLRLQLQPSNSSGPTRSHV